MNFGGFPPRTISEFYIVYETPTFSYFNSCSHTGPRLCSSDLVHPGRAVPSPRRRPEAAAAARPAPRPRPAPLPPPPPSPASLPPPPPPPPPPPAASPLPWLLARRQRSPPWPLRPVSLPAASWRASHRPGPRQLGHWRRSRHLLRSLPRDRGRLSLHRSLATSPVFSHGRLPLCK